MERNNEPSTVSQPRARERRCARKVTVDAVRQRVQSESEERRMRAAFDALLAEIARQEIVRAKEAHG
jgi:ribosome-associated translation inhibitor RaiA